jgi:hypothetical protein
VRTSQAPCGGQRHRVFYDAQRKSTFMKSKYKQAVRTSNDSYSARSCAISIQHAAHIHALFHK